MNKKLKVVLIGMGSLIALFAVVLVVHIAMVIGSKPSSSFYQMARVDFNSPVGPSEIETVNKDLAKNKGYISSYFNEEAGTFIYTFDARYANADELYNKAIKNTIADSKRYIVTDEMKMQGCPVGANNKFYSSITSAVTAVMY